jgi:hypothetical protein
MLFINNHNSNNYVHMTYPNELEIKDITESDLLIVGILSCYTDRF